MPAGFAAAIGGLSGAAIGGIAAGVGAIGGAIISSRGSKKAAQIQGDAASQAAATELEMFERNAQMQQPWLETGEGALSQLAAGTGDPRGAFDERRYLEMRPDAKEWIAAKNAEGGPTYTAYDHYVTDGSREPGFAPAAGPGDFQRDFTMADFAKDPGYQFRMDEGMRGIETSAAARGGALSGGNLKNIARFGQDYASGEFANAYNRFNADRDRRFGRLSQLAGIGQTAVGQVTNQGENVAGRVGEYQTQMGNARASGYVGQANAINKGIGRLSDYFGQQEQPSWGLPTMGGGSGYSWSAPQSSETKSALYGPMGYGGD